MSHHNLNKSNSGGERSHEAGRAFPVKVLQLSGETSDVRTRKCTHWPIRYPCDAVLSQLLTVTYKWRE